MIKYIQKIAEVFIFIYCKNTIIILYVLLYIFEKITKLIYYYEWEEENNMTLLCLSCDII